MKRLLRVIIKQLPWNNCNITHIIKINCSQFIEDIIITDKQIHDV